MKRLGGTINAYPQVEVVSLQRVCIVSLTPGIPHSGKGKTMELVRTEVFAKSHGKKGVNRWRMGNF